MSAVAYLLVKGLTRIGLLPRAALVDLDMRRAPSAQSVLDAGRMAENTFELLDGLNDEVVLIARMGQNLEQFGLTYSHLGFAVKGLHRGQWGVVHLLNAQDGNRSSIYEEGLVNFYSDDPYRMEACVLTLPKSVQARLKELVTMHARSVHCSNYSLTSYPWSLTTQNSNQWVLELLSKALCEQALQTREDVQAWLRTRGYVPSNLRIGLGTQWAGPLLRDCIRFDDQPLEQRQAGLIQTVTVDSVFAWLEGPQSPVSATLSEVRRMKIAL